MYNLETLIQMIKDDLELHDLPATVTDNDIKKRIHDSSLFEFSLLYPRLEKFRMNYNDIVDPMRVIGPRSKGIEYKVPKWFLIQYTPTVLVRCEPYRHGDPFGDSFAYAIGYESTDLIDDIAGVKSMAAIAGNMVHAPTSDYDSARKVITVYNGYYDGVYEVTMGVEHDINLQSIPPTAAITFKNLAKYDVGEYIYSKIFRKDSVETPVGNINLNIDLLRDCKSQHQELLKELSEDAPLDVMSIEYF